MSRNDRVFQQGIARARQMMERQIGQCMSDLAYELLYNAIQHWIESNNFNLTGNTLNSYASAVYHNGRVWTMWNARDAGVNAEPTANYTSPGKEILIYPYRSDEFLDEEYYMDQDNYTVVKEYKRSKGFKFQFVTPGSGPVDARKLLQSMHPNGYFTIVVCVAVPYANYLQATRNLDVLEAASKKMENDAIFNTIFGKTSKI